MGSPALPKTFPALHYMVTQRLINVILNYLSIKYTGGYSHPSLYSGHWLIVQSHTHQPICLLPISHSKNTNYGAQDGKGNEISDAGTNPELLFEAKLLDLGRFLE